MSGALLPNLRFQPFSALGRTLPGALLQVYLIGTSTPVVAYQDYELTTPHENPVEADGAGVFPSIYLATGGYTLVLTTALGVAVNTWDYLVGDAQGVTPEQFGALGNGAADDTAAFQAAIDALDDGGILQGTPGHIYKIGAAGVLISARTGLRLMGNGATIRAGAVATLAPSGLGSTLVALVSATDCVVQDWIFDGETRATNLLGLKTSTGCTVRDNTFRDGGLFGSVFAIGNTHNTYLHNRIEGGAGTARGVWIGNYGASELETAPLIAGNLIADAPATGIVCAADGGQCVQNTVTGTAGSGIIFGGANSRHASDLVIAQNVCTGNAFHGIQCDVSYASSADQPIGVVVQGNLCAENTLSGIYAVNLRSAIVSDNVCLDNGVSGISAQFVTGLTIAGNRCEDTRAGGSRTQSHGIYLDAADAREHAHILITGNACRNHLQRGISVSTVTGSDAIANLSVSQNHCLSNSTYGIFVTEAAAGTITNMALVGNVCIGNTTADLRTEPLDMAVGANSYRTQVGYQYWSFTDADTTPSVRGGRPQFRSAQTGATTITAFDDGVEGQAIEIWATNGNTTIQHGGTIVLKGAANAAMSADSFIRLRKINTVWFETGRSF